MSGGQRIGAWIGGYGALSVVSMISTFVSFLCVKRLTANAYIPFSVLLLWQIMVTITE